MESKADQRGSKNKKMKKLRQYFFILLLFLAAVLLGYNYFYRPFEVVDVQIPRDGVSGTGQMMADTKSSEEKLLQLTPKQRISQMVALPITVTVEFETSQNEVVDATQSADVLEEDLKFGFVTLFGKALPVNQVSSVIEEFKLSNTLFELKPLVAVDHEGGTVQRLSGEGFTKLGTWRSICSLSTQDREAVLKQSANELKDVGVDIVLAPVLDVGNNQILKDRICSMDSYAIVADRSMDYVTIFSELGILPVLKHFPGIGSTTKDLHTSYEYIDVLENDVKLYKYIIDQNSRIGVMTAHVGVSSQDPGIPCSVSPYCVTELNKAYPDVLIFTDALEMDAAAYDMDNPRVPKDLLQITKEAILAGNNVLIYGESVTQKELSAIISQLAIEYETNPQFQTRVDASVLKIIEYKGI